MLNNTIIFLRHAEIKVDSSKPISKWTLTDKGINVAKRLSEIEIFQDIDYIFSSYEEKAILTAENINYKLKLPIIKDKALNELNRDLGPKLTKEEYFSTVRICFNDLKRSVKKWEKPVKAIKRFIKKIDEIDKKYLDKKILIVSHGLIINLFFSWKTNNLESLFERWKSNSFLNYGIIQNNKIVKDIKK
ncbi:MAG TPA: histidine phosphatase family protein [Candidatus Bathyarchaeia archaeon]|nr:histidine phosphatase family protein [Candidatus Bathyarchaeia archaeon]